MSDERTIHGTGLEGSIDPEAEAGFALMRHRAALADGDPEAVERTLDLHTWGSGDPGILHRMSAEEGVEVAVNRLTAFWAGAETTIEDVRRVSEDEVEIYERVTPAGGARALHTVALVRRRGGRWRVVTTSNTTDERVHLCVLGARGSQPESLPADACVGFGELVVEGRTGILVDPERGFRLQLTVSDGFSARVDATDPEVQARLADGCAIVTLLGAAPRDVESRRAMLAWASGAAAACARRTGSDAVFLPSCERVLAPDALAALQAGRVTRTWAAVHDDGQTVYTRGATFAMLPEIEAPHAWGINPRPLVEAALAATLAGTLTLSPGTTVEIAGQPIDVYLGRRGPFEGTTYGRWGSRALHPIA